MDNKDKDKVESVESIKKTEDLFKKIEAALNTIPLEYKDTNTTVSRPKKKNFSRP